MRRPMIKAPSVFRRADYTQKDQTGKLLTGILHMCLLSLQLFSVRFSCPQSSCRFPRDFARLRDDSKLSFRHFGRLLEARQIFGECGEIVVIDLAFELRHARALLDRRRVLDEFHQPFDRVIGVRADFAEVRPARHHSAKSPRAARARSAGTGRRGTTRSRSSWRRPFQTRPIWWRTAGSRTTRSGVAGHLSPDRVAA